MADTQRSIESFHKEIVQWRAEGIGYRPIAERLKKLGVSGVNFNKVGRYCNKNNIPYNPPVAPAAVESAALAEGSPPPTDQDGQQKLFADSAPESEPKSWPEGRPREQREHPMNTGRSRVRATSEEVAAQGAPATPKPETAKPKSRLNLEIGNYSYGLPVEAVEAAGEERHQCGRATKDAIRKSESEMPPAEQAPQPKPSTSQQDAPPVATQALIPLSSAPLIRRGAWNTPPLPFPRMANPPLWTPELPLLGFGNENTWTLQDAFEGTFILGAIGSGKTSGSGRTLAHAFLERGFGGLVLTVKEDERELWQHYARQTGREHHLCIVQPRSPWHFNFLDYELWRPELGAGLIENLVDLFYTAVHSNGSESLRIQLADFWEDAGKQLVRNAFRILQHSRERLSLKEARKLMAQAPSSRRELEQGEWKQKDFGRWLQTAMATVRGTPQESVIEEATRYWLDEFPRLSDRTRSCIVTGFTALAEVFIEPAIHDLFCTDTTLTPEAALEGAIIVIDLPIKKYRAVGNFTQGIWKHLFQKTVEARSDALNPSCRPVFLWADEAQFFYSNNDSLFQSTARSSRCATVYLTQNLSNFYAAAGGHNARERVDGFLGNLNTKIFHCNNDPVSNHWAAEQIGKAMTYRFNSSSTTTPSNRPFGPPTISQTAGMQEAVDYEVQPVEFMKLRTGGNRFDRLVDAYLVKGGATFSNGKHFFPTVFQQESLS